MISHVNVRFDPFEVRSDIRRPLLAEARALLELYGFGKPDMMQVKFTPSEQSYMVHMSFGAAYHMFTIRERYISTDEKETIFRSLAEDARIPIYEDEECPF